jgi:hypothetical protein
MNNEILGKIYNLLYIETDIAEDELAGLCIKILEIINGEEKNIKKSTRS